MSTHRRAWKRAGVVVALVTGALVAVPATPAMAVDVSVSPGSVNLQAGGQATLTVQLSGDDGETATISVNGLPNGVSCANGCGEVTLGGGAATQQVVLRAAGNAPNGNANATVAAQGSETGGGQGRVQVRVQGRPETETPPPPEPEPTQEEVQTVRAVSGKVTVEANGDAVANANVLLLDSNGRRHETTSDGNGNFRFSGSTQNPIAPGQLQLGASRETAIARKTISARAGQSLTGQRISLPIRVEESPSPTPSPTAEPAPTVEAEEPDEEPTEGAEGVEQEPAASSADDSGGMGSWLLILLGGLFVAIGVGTIVLLWMKRRENADEPEVDEDAPAAAGATPNARGTFRGADDQTRVVNRIDAGPDPTMVGGAALSDAPTMMHQPVVDDVPPDPYGAPPQPFNTAGQQGWSGAGGYGDESPGQGGYGNAPASGAGYGNASGSGAGYGNAPASGAGYGNAPASGGGYGSRDYPGAPGGAEYPPTQAGGAGYGERYDEPTGRYQGEGTTSYPPPADPYATGLYQPATDPDPGYGQSGASPYGRSPESTGGQPASGGYGGQPGYEGYDDRRGGYDQQHGGPQASGGYAGGGYDQRGEAPGGYGDQGDATGGYGQQGGYGQPGGYQQQGGYDQSGGYQQGGGYGQQGGYGQSGGYQQQGGYDQSGGYQQGGYDQSGGYQQQGGYGQEPPRPRDGGYDQQSYDQQQGGGHYGDQNQPGRGRPDGPPPERGGRRLDWLDD
ncbi:carboxypeptidase regulatory-like domain-containing protein [Micromonospora sp. WMMA1923]|uniref:carboxypeptidase regulatory-like domain-containing protein n=1 Tax=Micromonospora sp. WMMA1923 TaxID=3404125 RepID=UPI003B947E68